MARLSLSVQLLGIVRVIGASEVPAAARHVIE
jgi:hypothetical protein